jgi:branched-chain amino acid transport system substrate-binding protein
MKKPVKIGFLAPHSGAYPFYTRQLTMALMLALGKGSFRKTRIQIVPVSTTPGGMHQNAEAARQLLFSERVDVLSGLVNHLTALSLIPLLESSGKMGFFMELGEYLPSFADCRPGIFYCSHELWQSEYALGYWSRDHLGSKGLIVTTEYEAGFDLDKAFVCGATTGRSTVIKRHLLSFRPRITGKIDLSAFFHEISVTRPDYVHALFSASNGAAFLECWRESPFFGHIPLVVNETMTYEETLSEVSVLELEMYAPSLWSATSTDHDNLRFLEKYQLVAGQRPNVFALLGYEAGCGLRAVWPKLVNRDGPAVKKLLQKEVVRGPSGLKTFRPGASQALPSTEIVRIHTGLGEVTREIVDRLPGVRPDAPELEKIPRGNHNGWHNPFLCP